MKENLNDIQKYMIGGFMEYGHAQDYKDILPADIFGIYSPMFRFLVDHGNVKTPDFYSISQKIGNKIVAQAMERADFSFLTHRNKYAEKLFNIYVTDTLSKEESPMDVLEKVKSTYLKLSYLKTESNGGITNIDTLLGSLLEEIGNAVEYGDSNQGYSTGIRFLDKYTGGLVKGRTMRLSAYSNTGKSALSYHIANSVLRQGAKVLYFSLEIPKEDLRNRLLSNYHEIPMWQFENKSNLKDIDLTEYSEKKLFVACETFNMNEVESLTKSLKPDVVFIDYVQLLKGEGNGEYEQMNDIARRIRKLTSDCNVAVFDLSQVSNEGKSYQAGSVIPTKGSGELVSAANIVLVMAEAKMPGRLNLHIAKNRHGKKGKCVELKPNFEISHFEEMSEGDPNGSKHF